MGEEVEGVDVDFRHAALDGVFVFPIACADFSVFFYRDATVVSVSLFIALLRFYILAELQTLGLLGI